jgi:hypothetical protein
MGVSGQRHAPAELLPPGKGPPVLIVQEAGWAPEPVWTQRLKQKYFALPGIEPRSPGRPVLSQTLYWLSYPAPNYRPISIVNNFFKIFESIIHDHLAFNFKSKLQTNQHDFLKSKSTINKSVASTVCLFTGPGSLSLFSQALDKVAHHILLDNTDQFVLSSSYVKFF